MLEIVPLTQKDDMRVLAQLAELWLEAFGRDDETPMAEIEACLAHDRLAFMAVENEYVVGFVGAIPQYGITGWELHPLMVAKSQQRRGVGGQLLQVVEDAVRARGGVTMYLGSDDLDFSTSLSNCDLYTNTFEKIANIQTLTPEQHPYEFYLRHGYSITGVIPDANGPGRPDIWMAKRL